MVTHWLLFWTVDGQQGKRFLDAEGGDQPSMRRTNVNADNVILGSSRSGDGVEDGLQEKMTRRSYQPDDFQRRSRQFMATFTPFNAAVSLAVVVGRQQASPLAG